jgi:transposase
MRRPANRDSSAAPSSPKVDLARRLSEAIWHMLTPNQPFARKGATDPLAA